MSKLLDSSRMWAGATRPRIRRTIHFSNDVDLKVYSMMYGGSLESLSGFQFAGAIAQLARASALQAECQGFESL